MVDVANDEKLSKVEELLKNVKDAMKIEVAGVGLINLNITKNPKMIEFLQKAMDLPVNGKVDQALLDKLEIKKIDDLTTTKVAAVIEKLQSEGKIGANSYKKPEEGGDPSYLIALSDALKGAEVRKFEKPRNNLLGGILGQVLPSGVGDVVNVVTGVLDRGQKEAADQFNKAKREFEAALPPRPSAAVVTQPASAPSAGQAPASAPVTPAPAPSAPAPAGSATITSNAFNEAITSSLKPLLNGTGPLGLKVDHETLRITPGQESRVVKFLEMALDLKDGEGKPIRTGKVSPELTAALGIDNISKLDGKKLMEVIEKVQGQGKFAEGGDPELAKALYNVVRDMKPSSNFNVPLKLAIESAQSDLKKALGEAVPKVSLGQDPIIVAAADVPVAKGGYVAGDVTNSFGMAVSLESALLVARYEPIEVTGLVGHEVVTPVNPVIAEAVETMRQDIENAVPKTTAPKV